jgi:hypothetical protein
MSAAATEHLHDKIADCETEMKAIDRDALDLQRAVEALVSDFAVKYPKVEMSGLNEDFASRLSDIVDDLQGPAYRRKSRIEDMIDDREWADLERSAVVVL